MVPYLGRQLVHYTTIKKHSQCSKKKNVMNEGSPCSKSESLKRKSCILTISQVPIIAKVCKSLLSIIILRENYTRRKEMRELILVSMPSIDLLFPGFMDNRELLSIRKRSLISDPFF